MTILSAIVFLTLMPLRSNKGAERRHTSFRSIAKNFRPPVKGARDYYFALIAKFCFTAGGFAITNYQLYILTDYIRLNPADAAGLIAINGLLTLGASVIFGFTSGPLSDKLRRRKPFVIAAALLVGLGVLFPLLAPASWAFLAYGLLGGIGSGIFTSVDQALNIDVLPDKSQAAKDLGILNIGTTAGQLAGPVIMSVLVLTTGGYSAGFVAVLVLMVLAAAFILPIKKVR